MRQKHLTKYRRAVIAAARGRVFEIGVGSGLNLPLYGKQVEPVYGIDPSPRLLAIARRRAAASGVPVELLLGSTGVDQTPFDGAAYGSTVGYFSYRTATLV